MSFDDLKKLDDAVSSCMKCGFCKAACPLFTDEETTSPRAKVRLARGVARGEIDLTKAVSHHMSRCLNCRACAAECPGGVEPNKIALAMRERVVERDGLSLIKRMIFRRGLLNPRLMAIGTRIMGIGQHLTLIDAQNNPLRKLLPLVGMRADKDLPVLGRRSLLARLPERMSAIGERKVTVVYFPGCATNLLYPDTGMAAVNVLRKLGAEVILPHDLVCCSTPVFNSGDVRGARELAMHNVRIINRIDPDYIITSCGSCGLTIKSEWADVLQISESEKIGKRVLDISEFVAKFAPDGAIKQLNEDRIFTYHDSCHLRRGMGVFNEPRQLLSTMLGSNFVEMQMADRCCGGGGTFSIYYPRLSQTVAETKMQCVSESGAEVVATGCPACIMQLRDSIVHRKMPQKVVHTIELIDKALAPIS